MEPLICRVERALADAFPSATVRVEALDDGRVFGDIEWDGFEPGRHRERQQSVRRALVQRLPPAEAGRVVSILAFTPTEAESIRREAEEPADLMI